MNTITNNMTKMIQSVRCTREIKSSITVAIPTFNKQKAVFTNKLDFIVRKKLVKFYVGSIDLYSAQNWSLCKVNQKYLESSEIRFWRRI